MLAIAALLAAGLAAAWSCDSGDSGRGGEVAGGGDAGGDGGDGGDTDTGTGDCTGFDGQGEDWDLDKVVTMVEFPAIFGTGGEETVLAMHDVFCNHEEVKSLVFVIGTNS